MQRVALPIYSRAENLEDMRALRFRVVRAPLGGDHPAAGAHRARSRRRSSRGCTARPGSPPCLPTQILAIAGVTYPVSAGPRRADPRGRAAGHAHGREPRPVRRVRRHAAGLAPHGLVAVCCGVAAVAYAQALAVHWFVLDRRVGIPIADVWRDVRPALGLDRRARGGRDGRADRARRRGAGPAIVVVAAVAAGGLAYLGVLRGAFAGAWADLVLLAARRRSRARRAASAAASPATRRWLAHDPARSDPHTPDRPARPGVDVVVPFAGRPRRCEASSTGSPPCGWRRATRSSSLDNRPGEPERCATWRVDGRRCPRAPVVLLRAQRRRRRGARSGCCSSTPTSRPRTISSTRYFDRRPGERTAVLVGAVADEPPMAPDGPAAGRALGVPAGVAEPGEHARSPPEPYAKTANCAVRRAAFEAVGGFRDDIRSGGDADLCFRLCRRGLGARAPRRCRRAAPQPPARCASSCASRPRHGSGSAWLERALSRLLAAQALARTRRVGRARVGWPRPARSPPASATHGAAARCRSARHVGLRGRTARAEHGRRCRAAAPVTAATLIPPAPAPAADAAAPVRGRVAHVMHRFGAAVGDVRPRRDGGPRGARLGALARGAGGRQPAVADRRAGARAARVGGGRPAGATGWPTACPRRAPASAAPSRAATCARSPARRSTCSTPTSAGPAPTRRSPPAACAARCS